MNTKGWDLSTMVILKFLTIFFQINLKQFKKKKKLHVVGLVDWLCNKFYAI